MKILKKILILLLLVVSISGISCAAKPSSAQTTQNQIATAQRGNLTIGITASGNLSLARTADLAFEMSGTVQEVLVEVGDNVTEGQELAKLDTTAWEDQITTLERQLTAARRKLTTAERAVTTAERQLATAQRQLITTVEAKKQALIQSQISLKNAEIALAKAEDTYHAPDIRVAQADVDTAKAYLQYALDGTAEGKPWQNLVNREKAALDAAQSKLDAMLTGADPDDIAIKKSQLIIAQANLKDAEDAVPQAEEDSRVVVENATLAVDDAKANVEDAKLAVDDAQSALDEAKKTSPLIKAPFAGFVTLVDVQGGDDILKGKVAVQIADPNKFEANILVNEIDIAKVKVAGVAQVQPSSLGMLTLPATITKISPTATISQGVVNYQVTVEVQQAATATQGHSETGQVPPQSSTGQPPTTQSGTGQTTGRTFGQMGSRQQMLLAPGDSQLRQGLTVTINIVVQQKQDVLLVPSAAITRQGGQSYVQVISSTGSTEQRAVTTGITDYQYTEITSGLNEGDKVIVPRNTAPTTSSSQQRPPGGAMFFGPR